MCALFKFAVFFEHEIEKKGQKPIFDDLSSHKVITSSHPSFIYNRMAMPDNTNIFQNRNIKKWNPLLREYHHHLNFLFTHKINQLSNGDRFSRRLSRCWWVAILKGLRPIFFLVQSDRSKLRFFSCFFTKQACNWLSIEHFRVLVIIETYLRFLVRL